MDNNFKKEFIKECKNNRIYLGYTFSDISKVLIDVSEDEYMKFEDGKYNMSNENVKRLIRVLCIKKPTDIDINKYIDITGLDDVEIEDLSNILEVIVGEDND